MPPAPVHGVVTFGEIMLRLSPPGSARFVQAEEFDAHYGGAEANVAVALAQFGMASTFVSKVPAHELGQAAVNHLRRYGVRTDHVVRGGDRLGIYFLEAGASQRPSRVIYDRAGSAFTSLAPEEVDWEAVFRGARWFHWTGITPALGPESRRVLERALRAARAAGVTVSCDLNFRSRLWSGAEARAVMPPLMEHVDVCIVNGEAARQSLGFHTSTDVEGGFLDDDGCRALARELKEAYGFEAVAVTSRESLSASRNRWSATFHDDEQCAEPYHSAVYDVQIVDRIGGGDSFAAGLIYGLLHRDDSRAALEFAVAASCLKLTVPGDAALVSVDEVERLVASGGSGRVDR
jgi:2-dehydro-3-deoxygluconokinase